MKKAPRFVMHGTATEELMDALEDVLFEALQRSMGNDYDAALAKWNAMANDPRQRAWIQDALASLVLVTDPSQVDGEVIALSCGLDDAFVDDTVTKAGVH